MSTEGFVLWAIIIVAYWTPSFVASIRKVPNIGSVIVINLFLGWSVIGWIVALAMGFRSGPESQRQQLPDYRPPVLRR